MAPSFDDLTLAEDAASRQLRAARVFLAKAEEAIRRSEAALARLRQVVERAEVAAARPGWDVLDRGTRFRGVYQPDVSDKEAPDAPRDR